MTDALEERDERLGGFVDGPALEDYAEKYADHFVIERNEGVAEVRMHTGDRAAVFSRGLLNAWGQLLRDLGASRPLCRKLKVTLQLYRVTPRDTATITPGGEPSFARNVATRSLVLPGS